MLELETINSPPLEQFSKRRYNWNMSEAIFGVCSRLYRGIAVSTELPDISFDGLLVPEKLENRTISEILVLRKKLSGPSVVVFHDLIPVKFPEYATKRSAAKFKRYLNLLLSFDGIAAVSESSKQDLLDYWKTNRIQNPPPVETISPGTSLKESGNEAERHGSQNVPQVLMVGSIEPRKNHQAALEACERIWKQGLNFELIIAGRISNEGCRDVVESVQKMKAQRLPIKWLGYVADEELERLYEHCRFTLHPSLYEGFGLPVIESLSKGKPCIASRRGALAETATKGGCYLVDETTPESIASGIRELLLNQDLYERLVCECRERKYKSWADYCDELTRWQRTLKKRAVN